MSTRVLLNALFLDPGVSGGVETYLYGLAPRLRELRPDCTLGVVTTRRGARALRERGWESAGIDIHELPCDEGQRGQRQLAEQVLLPLLAGRLRADVVHSLSSIGPIRVPRAAHVITLHDVTFLHHRTFNAVTTWGLTQLVPRVARHAQHLIADTAVARDDVCATLDLDPDRFTVVPLGVESPNASATDPAILRARLGLGDARVVMCVSAKRPHKNQEVLVRAMARLPVDMRLLLVGHPESYDTTLRALSDELELRERVVFTDWIDDADLAGLWATVSVAAVPSLAEGFGLPLIEAIARGLPVVASDIPVLREVGGTIPRWFNPRDPAAAADAILDAIADPPDPILERQWTERFTWSAAARATWEVYDQSLIAHRRLSTGVRSLARLRPTR